MLPSENRAPISAFAVYRQQFQATQKKNAAKNTANKRKLEQSQASPKPMPVKKVKNDSKQMKKPSQAAAKQLEINGDDIVPTLVPLERGDEEMRLPLRVDDPTVEAANLFKWLISPVTPEKFLEKHWEKESLYVERTNSSYYSHLLSSSMLDKIFRNNLLHYTRNVDVVSYDKVTGVKETHNPEGRAVPSALWDFYSNGCSIRLLNPQTYSHKVHFLLVTLQEYFGTMVGANVYLTPPGSQGFAPHFDDIEAFVIQLEGRKHWRLYKPNDSDVLARDSSHNFMKEELGEPFMDLTLHAGQVLYFPRGTIHQGRTDDDAHSLHITISVYQHTAYIDLMEHLMPAVLKSAALNNVDFRKGLPLNYLKHTGLVNKNQKSSQRKSMLGNVRNLFKSLIDHVSDAEIDKAADLLGAKFMSDSLPPIPFKNEAGRTSKEDGDYLDNGEVRDRVEISLDTKVRLLRYYCVRLVTEGDAIKLYYNTENANVYHGEDEQWLELDPSMADAITALQKAYPKYLEVEALPIEDITFKLRLICDLWEHGILVTEQPLECLSDGDPEDESS